MMRETGRRMKETDKRIEKSIKEMEDLKKTVELGSFTQARAARGALKAVKKI
ncbi:MAG: hypothetical protein LBD44_03785 [Spirochaetaceae bacterium]|nr:hypothetical protein [Spirochaetaceae bacterium]